MRVQGGFPAVYRQCPGIMRTRGKFLHVIARSEATWQSVLLAAVQNKKQYLGRIRKSAYEFARSSTKLPGFSAGTRIAAPVCALVRNDRFGRHVRTRARVQCTTFLPGDADCRTSALQPQGRCRLQHVIARSEATWQSVLLAAVQNKKQYFGRIRKNAYEFARSSTKLPGFSAGTRIAAPVCALVRNDRFGRHVRTRARVQCTTFLPGDADCRRCAHWFAMTCRNMRRECVCKNVGRNDIHKPGGQAHRRAKESLDKAPAPVVQWRQLNITKNGKSKAGIVHREPGHWLEARRREAPQVRPGVKGAAPLAASRP